MSLVENRCASFPPYLLLAGRCVVIFNAFFDQRLLRQTAAAFGDPQPWPDACTTRCAMQLAAKAFGASRHGRISLACATEVAGVTWQGAAHSAAADVLATVDLVQAMAQTHRELCLALAALEAGRDP